MVRGLVLGLLLLSAGLIPGSEVTSSSNDWVVVTVDPDNGTLSSLSLDFHGRPHISYCGDGHRYVYWNSREWINQLIENSGGCFSSLALDTKGHPHISFETARQVGLPEDPTMESELKYAHWDGTNWIIQTIQPPLLDVFMPNTLTLDSNERPHVIYGCCGLPLRYAYWNGTQWNIEVIGRYSDVSSLVLDREDRAHTSSSRSHLIYLHREISGWVSEVVDDQADVLNSFLDLDSRDYPHIVYWDENTPNLKYAYWNGTIWKLEEIPGTSGISGAPSLVLDSNDLPHVIYREGTDSDIRYVYWDGSVWKNDLVVSSERLGEYSFALDNFNLPHIVYGETRPSTLKYTYIPTTRHFVYLPFGSR